MNAPHIIRRLFPAPADTIGDDLYDLLAEVEKVDLPTLASLKGIFEGKTNPRYKGMSSEEAVAKMRAEWDGWIDDDPVDTSGDDLYDLMAEVDA